MVIQYIAEMLGQGGKANADFDHTGLSLLLIPIILGWRLRHGFKRSGLSRWQDYAASLMPTPSTEFSDGWNAFFSTSNRFTTKTGWKYRLAFSFAISIVFAAGVAAYMHFFRT